MSSDNGSPAGSPQVPVNTEHLNIKVSDNNNEVFFKIKRSTKLEKLMSAFCERQGRSPNSVRFLFEGTRVQPTDTPDGVRLLPPLPFPPSTPPFSRPGVRLDKMLTCEIRSSKCRTATSSMSTRSRSEERTKKCLSRNTGEDELE